MSTMFPILASSIPVPTGTVPSLQEAVMAAKNQVEVTHSATGVFPSSTHPHVTTSVHSQLLAALRAVKRGAL